MSGVAAGEARPHIRVWYHLRADGHLLSAPMSTPNTPIKMPDINLSSPSALEQIQDAKLRLNTMTWRLYAGAIDDFFKQWPEIACLYVENNGNYSEPKPCFKPSEWVLGQQPDLGVAEQQRLDDALEALGEKTFALNDAGLLQAIDVMFSLAYLNSDEVIVILGKLWRHGQVDPNKASAHWNGLVAEVSQAGMEDGVDQPTSVASKPAARM